MQITAAASLAACCSDSSAVLPEILQKMPFCLVGIAPSTTRMYFPLLALMESCSDFSAWAPEPAIKVS